MKDTFSKEIEKLNRSEKLLLVESLWDSIASEPEDVPLPEHHKTILDERLKTLDEATEKGEVSRTRTTHPSKRDSGLSWYHS